MPLKIDMDKSPKAQLEALRNRQKLITTSKWNELEKEAHDKAFTVAKVMSADVLQDIYDYVQTAVKEGLSYKSFKDRVRNGGLVERMQNAGWLKTATDKQIGARLQVIIDTNVKMAYGKGNYNRLMLVKDKKPYWIYHQVERKTKRAEHSIYNGRKFHCDDPIWNTIYPPSGFRCSCWVEAVAEPDGVESGSNIEINPDEHPISPLSVWKPETTKYVEGIGKALEGSLRTKNDENDWNLDLLEGEDWESWYDLDCDIDEPSHFSSIDEAITFGRGNKKKMVCSQPIKNQPNWQDYGLKTLKDPDNASSTIEKLDLDLKDIDGLERTFYHYITNGTNKNYKVKTPIQEIIITKNLVKHTLYKWVTDENGKPKRIVKDKKRTRYAHCVLPSLIEPDEIWEIDFKNPKTQKIEKRIRYFKLFEVTNASDGIRSVMVVASYRKKNGDYLITIIPREMKKANQCRQGKLLYANPNVISNMKKYKKAIRKYK